MPQLYYTRVIVHGTIPAESAEDALALLNERIRNGIGPDPADGNREWGVSVAASVVSDNANKVEIVATNKEFMRRLAGL